MTQDVDSTIRARIRGLRLANGWSLDALATRCHLSPSTLSRIETGQRRITIDQLVPIARALGTSIDELVESDEDEDVIIRPHRHVERGETAWIMSEDDGRVVAKMRVTARRKTLRVHPGRDWFLVLSGAARLQLGERQVIVEAGQAAQFNTMTPHAVTAHGGPVEMLVIFDRHGRRAHFDAVDLSPPSG